MNKKNKIQVELSSNPTTGFSWQCDVLDKTVAELTKTSYKQKDAPKGLVGVGGTETFIFTCKKEGKTKVIFTYRRPWKGGETAEIKNATITVEKNLSGTISFEED